jgi:hypothetical protein
VCVLLLYLPSVGGNRTDGWRTDRPVNHVNVSSYQTYKIIISLIGLGLGKWAGLWFSFKNVKGKGRTGRDLSKGKGRMR